MKIIDELREEIIRNANDDASKNGGEPDCSMELEALDNLVAYSYNNTYTQSDLNRIMLEKIDELEERIKSLESYCGPRYLK